MQGKEKLFDLVRIQTHDHTILITRTTFAKVNFCRQIQGKVGKHTFLGKQYALNTKMLFTKLDLAILTFKSVIFISIRS